MNPYVNCICICSLEFDEEVLDATLVEEMEVEAEMDNQQQEELVPYLKEITTSNFR